MSLLQRTIELIDQANAEDPNLVEHDGRQWPKELLYSHQMTRWLNALEPQASEALQIAARAQHIRRWQVPRETYPMTREGYLAWRKYMYDFHADQAAAIMQQVGYDQATIDRVRFLLRKQQLKADPESQTLEDAAALVFLEGYFAEFRARKDYDDQKWANILRRTWLKMSERGRAQAMQLPLDDESRRLIQLALQQ
mgnify:FL=1